MPGPRSACASRRGWSAPRRPTAAASTPRTTAAACWRPAASTWRCSTCAWAPIPATVAALFDPDRVPTPLSRGALRRNYTGIADEALAGLPEAAQASLDVASRRLGYAKLQRKVNALLPYIVLYEPPQIVVDDGHVANLRPAPQDGGTLWNAWEWARLP